MNGRLRIAVLERDGYRCAYCGASAADGVRLHVDHFIPRHLGGWDGTDNLLTACEACNLGKSGTLRQLPRVLCGVLEPGKCYTGDGRRVEAFAWVKRPDGRPYLLRHCHDHYPDLAGFTAIDLGYAW
jgi:hypothetical protein